MSRFLTYWRRDGAAVPPDLHAAASAVQAPGVRSLDQGDVVARHWPSAWAPGAEEALPLAREGWVGSGVLRLDDRHTLAARLRDAGADGAADDATLAWRALGAWGIDAPSRWIGDVVLAVVAPRRERLVVARSGVGVRSCFHRTVSGVECVSDDLALLVSLGESPALDEVAVHEYLRAGFVISATRTFHRGITRVPPWHTLVVERDGSARQFTHRELPAPAIVHGRTESEVIEEFRGVVRLALTDRLRGPRASVMLSGGLDSPTLAVEARRATPATHLTAVTFAWSAMLGEAEARFARLASAAARIGHDVIEFAADAALRPEVPFVSPEPLPDPEPLLWRQQASRLAAVAPVALLGEDMDALLAPATLFEQVRTDGIVRTARTWLAQGAQARQHPWIGARRWFESSGSMEMADPPPPPWLRAKANAERTRPPLARHPTRALAGAMLRHPIWDATCWLDDPRMSGSDVVVLLPFMDPRVMEFCFALPSVPWLQRKHLLRRAMRGVLPDALLERAKTPLRGYVEGRVAAWRAMASPRDVAAGVAEWVDLDRWRDVLATGEAESVHAAWRVLELSRWLSQPRAGRA